MQPIRPFSKKLRLVLLVAALGLLVTACILFLLARNLTPIARWGLQRSLPAAKIDIQNVAISAPGEIQFENLIIHDPKTGRELLRLEHGSLIFSFDDLAKRQLGEIRLQNPEFVISPGWSGILPKIPTDPQSGNPITIRRIVCDYGEIHYDGEPIGSPSVRAKFCLDWTNFHADQLDTLSLELWDIRANAPGFTDPFLVLDSVTITGAPAELIQKCELRSLDISGGALAVGSALDQITHSSDATGSDTGAAFNWKIGLLNISKVRTTLGENAWKPESDISFVLNTSLVNLSPAEITKTLGSTEQVVEITDLHIPSPLDPKTTVLKLRSVLLRFDLNGILHHKLNEVTILHPVIYIEEDLFAYMDETSRRISAGMGPLSTPWTIQKLDIQFGSLVLGSGGNTQYGLPLNFQTSAENVTLNDLASLKLKGSLLIPAQEYKFPAYQLEIATQPGELQFSYPPSKGVSNVVGTIRVKEIRWRQYQSKESWASVTFDREGINGTFGGGLYRGQILGGFSFLFDATSPWIGWLGGAGINLEQLTDIIAPQNFRMSGPLGFKMQMNFLGRKLERLKGDFATTAPGRLQISKLDDLLARIPDGWSGLKKSSLRIALESARDFNYDTCRGDFWFVRDQGLLDLKLQGPLGSRTFQTVLHADESTDGLWKKTPNR